MTFKPLGYKCYGSIPHILGSRLGPGDHHISVGQSRICTEETRDKYDEVVVLEKLDGSCCGVVLLNDQLLALNKAGYLATSSPHEQHHLFAIWVQQNEGRFRLVLNEGERIIGEWLALAHGTKYSCNTIFEPFIAFDLMKDGTRLIFDEFIERLCCGIDYPPQRPLVTPSILSQGPTLPELALSRDHNPWRLDPPEGIVYRVERKGKVDFLAKYVVPDKIDGKYFETPIWNWRPKEMPLPSLKLGTMNVKPGG